MTDTADSPATGWAVALAVKLSPGAKSRLRPASVDDAAHAALVQAIRADTLAAVRACPLVRLVVVVGDAVQPSDGVQPSDAAEVSAVDIRQHTPGLNGAFADAARHIRRHAPELPVAALVADLPALRPDDLAQALSTAAESAHGFVRDADGTGTTLVAALDSARFVSYFGPDSAARHAATMAELPAGPGLRRDIDTPDDLRAAVDLGVGAHTRSLLARVGYAPFTSARHD